MPDQGLPEETLKEVMSAVIEKLVEVTPSAYLRHVSYYATRDAIAYNATAIAGQLKDSPTFAILVKQMSASFGGNRDGNPE